jgi:putrescine aminotransferase
MEPEALFSDVLAKYSDHLNPYLAKLMAFGGFGVEIDAQGCVIVDHEGRSFIDCLGGYGTFALGHRHPRVVQAVKDQLDHMGLSGKAFFCKPAADLASNLAEVAPPGLQYSFFCNSGTEAVEAGLKFAKAITGRTKIVSTEGSYHGKTIGALSVTGREKYRKRYVPLMPGAEFVPFGDASAAEAAIDGATAAMIIEPIQGEGGIVIPPDGYLARLRRACDAHGALLIVDEVQTGLGRTGTMFACERDGVSPDLMPLAKSLGGGVMPLGAIMGTKAIFDDVFGSNPLAHSSTFGGNGLACAAGIAALQVISDENLIEKSATQGKLLKAGLEAECARFGELVSEVRGRGLMIGVEFSMDEVGELVVAQLMKRGVCVAYALNNPRVLRFEPPLIISNSQIEQVVEAMAAALAETAELLSMLV